MQALTAVRPPCWDPLFLLGFTLTSCPQVPLDERIIFSGNLFQYQEDNKKWRNRFSLVPHNYGLVLYENKVVSESGLPLAASHRPLHLPPSYSVTPIPNLRLQAPCFPHSRLPPVFLHGKLPEPSPLLQTCLPGGSFSQCPLPFVQVSTSLTLLALWSCPSPTKSLAQRRACPLLALVSFVASLPTSPRRPLHP